MKFKHKLQMFLVPAILIPAVVVMAINFFILKHHLLDLEYELLQDAIRYIVEKCGTGYHQITALGMEEVAFYQEAAKKAVLQEIRDNSKTSRIIAIVDRRSFAIIFPPAAEAPTFFHGLDTLQRMAQEAHGLGEYRLTSPSGERLAVIAAFDVYEPWNWLVIAQAEQKAVYRHLHAAMIASSLAIGGFMLIVFGVIYRWSNSVSTSLERLEQGTRRLAEHDFNVVIDIAGEDEFGRLANSFNLMTAAIHQAQRELKTALQRAEDANRALRESEERLRLTTDNLPDSYVYQYTYNAAGTPQFLFVSNSVERIHPGIKVADILQDAAVLHNQIDADQFPALMAAEAESARNL